MPQNRDNFLDDLYAEGATDQPPAELDAAILTAAAQAAKRTAPSSRPRSLRYAGWATAAVVLLTVGVLFNNLGQFAPEPESAIDARPIVITQPPPETNTVPRSSADTAPAMKAEPASIPPEEQQAPQAQRQRFDQPMPASRPLSEAVSVLDSDVQPTAAIRQLASRPAAQPLTSDSPEKPPGCDDMEITSGYQTCQGRSALLVQHPGCATPLMLTDASLQASGIDGALLRQQEVLYKATCVDARWVVEAQ
ncbi:MAG: hypothetical protein O7C67_04990 [Gammaproteobacteria bacterium]|nr:hypothetical protein [Gammaproteobacteria bacterium]